MNQALDNFLLLVYPSGKIIFGLDSLKKTKKEKVKLIVLFTESSAKTMETTKNYADINNIKLISLKREAVPRFVNDKNLALVSVLDANIASKIINLVKEGETYE